MSKKKLETLRSGYEFIQYAKTQDCTIRNGHGSHMVVSNDKGSIVIPSHRSDLGKGLRCKIVKAFVALGLAGLLFACFAILL